MPTDGTGSAKVQRRLAAILAADIAGYSALMGADEVCTVRNLKAHQAVILPMIGCHGGRIIDTAGDGILAEFSSVVNAVECALAIQRTMEQRNAEVEEGSRMRYRIGINLGDVIHDQSRIFGDGVNIAARLESIADPGGICISSDVYRQVHRKLPLQFIDLGEQQLKNIAQAVRVYRIEPQVSANGAPQAKPPLALPDKPSIAVLPFTNLSGDPKEEYFSDGITEDIITELSRFSELFVIARNSSFQYKGKSPDIRQVGRELGVRYVLEGSIRRAGDRVRITGQLIDAATGAHRWAERYDRELEDVFGVQDEVARTIVTVLAAHVNKAEAERVLLKPPSAWQVYDHYISASAAYATFLSSMKVDQLYQTRKLLEKATSIDPNYARAYALLAETHLAAWVNPWDQDHLNPKCLDHAHALASKSVQLDHNLPQAHAELGVVLIFKHQHQASIDEFKKAFQLNPNYTNWWYAGIVAYAGDPESAIHIAKAHMRLDPFYPAWALTCIGAAHYMLKQYAEALPYLRECVSRAPNFRSGHVWSSAIYAQLGQLAEARAAAAEILRIDPTYTIQKTAKLAVFKDPVQAEHYLDGLRKAGLPEGRSFISDGNSSLPS